MAQFAALGFDRVCLGVQDFQEATGRAVNRLQSYEQTKSAVAWAREFGIPSVGIDLIYGLPLQTRASFARTIDDVLRLRPERIAVYSYAHVPWVNHAQRTCEQLLPGRVEKFGMIIDAIGTLTAVGYVQVGIDHFAARHDALAAAGQGESDAYLHGLFTSPRGCPHRRRCKCHFHFLRCLRRETPLPAQTRDAARWFRPTSSARVLL